MDKKFLYMNIINFAKVERGGGKTLIHHKWIVCQVFLKPFPDVSLQTVIVSKLKMQGIPKCWVKVFGGRGGQGSEQ